MDYRSEASPIIRDFLVYHETIKGHSQLTSNEYFLDLRTFFRYLKLERGLVPSDTPIEEISVSDVDLQLVSSVTLADVYDFMSYLSRDRERRHNAPEAGSGLNAASRSRKVSTLRSFYKYLTTKANLLEENPIAGLDSPKLKQSLPRYLTVDESLALLDAVDGENKERDYCILVIFLNCGLRISELVGLNVSDVMISSNDESTLRVLGKGNKERTVYLNDACREALASWLEVRSKLTLERSDRAALFVSARRHKRVSTDAVHAMVKKTLLKAGLDASKYSSHKLRHTAATLMHQNGVDVRTLQQLLGHENLNTTQIYTHVASEDLKYAANANPLGNVKKSK